MDTCELLIVALFIILAVVPLGVIMAIVEIVNKRRMVRQRNRMGARRTLNNNNFSVL